MRKRCCFLESLNSSDSFENRREGTGFEVEGGEFVAVAVAAVPLACAGLGPAQERARQILECGSELAT